MPVGSSNITGRVPRAGRFWARTSSPFPVPLSPDPVPKPPRGQRLAEAVRAVDVRVWRVLARVTDSALTLLAFALAYAVRYQLEWFKGVEPIHTQAFAVYAPSAWGLLGIQLLVFQGAGIYRPRPAGGWLNEAFALASASTLSILILIIAHLFFNPLLYSRLVFLYTAVGMTVLLSGLRLLLRPVRRFLHRRGVGVARVLLAGTGELGRMVMRNIVAQPHLGWEILGFLNEGEGAGEGDIGRFKMLGPVTRLGEILTSLQPDKVIICLSWRNYALAEETLRLCRARNVPAQVVPNLFQVTRNQIKLDVLNGVPLLSVQPVSLAGWNYLLKRLGDLALCVALGLPFLLIGGLAALAIWLESGRPVIYTQTRIGRHRHPFRVFKFRTMVNDADDRLEEVADLDTASGIFFKIRDDPRRTRVGRVLRGFSLDEIPQCINVLKGEMSFIGPRPSLPAEVERYADWHQKRLDIMPGITGLWQVSGRSDLTFDEMVLLDIYYAENWNLGLDLGIALRTIPTVLLRRGAY